jgi:CID domain
MVAEDHADSRKNAAAIYNVIKESLISKQVSSDRKLPLVYLIDSILKNVKGKYISIIEADATNWLSIVYPSLPDDKRTKLKKVYNLWRDAGVFSEASWKKMGAALVSAPASSTAGPDVDPKLETAGINYGVRVVSYSLGSALSLSYYVS